MAESKYVCLYSSDDFARYQHYYFEKGIKDVTEILKKRCDYSVYQLYKDCYGHFTGYYNPNYKDCYGHFTGYYNPNYHFYYNLQGKIIAELLERKVFGVETFVEPMKTYQHH